MMAVDTFINQNGNDFWDATVERKPIKIIHAIISNKINANAQMESEAIEEDIDLRGKDIKDK